MARARILIVEDEPVVATDLRYELTEMGYEIAGVALDGETAIRLATTEKPSLILMDIGLQGQMNGIDAAEQIRRSFGIPVVYLTAYVDDKTLNRAKATHPFGYLVKPFRADQLRTTITVALHRHQEEEKRSQQIREYASTLREINVVLGRANPISESRPDVVPNRLGHGSNKLSQREREVLLHLLDGASVRKIAGALYISVHTVRNHLKAIFQKLDVHSQVELISKFRGADGH